MIMRGMINNNITLCGGISFDQKVYFSHGRGQGATILLLQMGTIKFFRGFVDNSESRLAPGIV